MLISHCIENGMPAEAQEWYRLLCDETDHDHTVQPNKNTRKLLNKIRFGQPGVTGTGTTAPGVVDNGKGPIDLQTLARNRDVTENRRSMIAMLTGPQSAGPRRSVSE